VWILEPEVFVLFALSHCVISSSAGRRDRQLVVVVDRFVVDVDGVVVVVGPDGVDELVVVEGETGMAGVMVVGVVGFGSVVVVVVVVDVVGAVPVSAETQPEGGVERLPWPGIRTVPAHPKFEKCASRVTVPPSANVTVDADSRMNPDASIETRSLMVR
jgi:hypothetical protein